MAFSRFFGLMLTFNCMIWAQDANDIPFFQYPVQATVPQGVRDARDKTFNVRGDSMIEAGQPGAPPPVTWYHFASQPELPYANTDTVVLGNITHIQPFFTADMKGIYTEYTLEVVETVNNTLVSASPGDSLTLLRKGGEGRLPDGSVVQHHIGNDVIPVVGQQYLVFLNYQIDLDAFYYAKMWLVQEGVMKAIYPDDVGRVQRGESECAGRPVWEVLDVLRDRINRN